MRAGCSEGAARRLGEAGWAEKQIAAITGRDTLNDIARYTNAVSQVHLARAILNHLMQGGGAAISTP